MHLSGGHSYAGSTNHDATYDDSTNHDAAYDGSTNHDATYDDSTNHDATYCQGGRRKGGGALEAVTEVRRLQIS